MSRPTIDHIDRQWAQLENRPTPTADQWDRWRRIVLDQAPDLAEMLGVAS